MQYTDLSKNAQSTPDPAARYDAVMKLIWDHAPKTLTIEQASTLAFKMELLLRNPVGFGVSAEGPAPTEPLGTDAIGVFNIPDSCQTGG